VLQWSIAAVSASIEYSFVTLDPVFDPEHLHLEGRDLTGAKRQNVWFEMICYCNDKMRGGLGNMSPGNRLAKISRNPLQCQQDLTTVNSHRLCLPLITAKAEFENTRQLRNYARARSFTIYHQHNVALLLNVVASAERRRWQKFFLA
jgi:hypothetical protein